MTSNFGYGGLDGKVALISGASRGIGLGIATQLVAAGSRVVITGRDQSALDEAVVALGGNDVAAAVAGKADDPDHQRLAVSHALETFGSLDLLVNNAGINPVVGPLVELEMGAARKVLDVNLLGPLAWIQAAMEAGLADRRGSIVNVSSTSGVRTAPGLGMYGVSKAALSYMTRILASELGPEVRINAVAPAVVKTRFAQSLYEGREDEVASTYPLRRLGAPADIGAAVAFLLSDEASWITGQTLVVDGGITVV